MENSGVVYMNMDKWTQGILPHKVKNEILTEIDRVDRKRKNI